MPRIARKFNGRNDDEIFPVIPIFETSPCRSFPSCR